jgi:hypothetical protein
VPAEDSVPEKANSYLEIVSPVADYQDTAQGIATHARRPGSIKGKTATLLPSEKSSSPPFIRALAHRMAGETEAGHVVMHNPDWAFFHPKRAAAITPEIDTLARDCDLVVCGVAY